MLRRLAGCLLLCAACAGFAVPTAAVDDAERDAFIEQMIAVAAEELGYQEEAGGYTKYADWGGENKYGEWCSEFASWCAAQADLRLSTNYLDYMYPMQTACAIGVRWFTERGRYVSAAGELKGFGPQWYRSDGVSLAERPYLPRRGDLVYFEWYQYNRIDHVGVVEYVEMNADGSFTVHTIEGNNPDTVERFAYPLDDPSIRAYGVTRDEIGADLREGCKGEIVKEMQQLLVDGGYGSFTPDGSFGPRTLEAVREFQRVYGLAVTGVADYPTQRAMGLMTGDPLPRPTPLPTEEPPEGLAEELSLE